jgi:bacterioferritin-associated ferredoxin
MRAGPAGGQRRPRLPREGIPVRERGRGDEQLVCRCEEVSRAEVLAAIDEGVTTVAGLRRRLRIGMGLCQGRTCRRLLTQLLAERLGVSPADVRPGTVRPPVRAVSLAALADEREAPLPPREGGTA